MKYPDCIRITIQHAPIGDGIDWIVDIAVHKDGKAEADSWHTTTLENVIWGVPEILKQYIPEYSIAHHD